MTWLTGIGELLLGVVSLAAFIFFRRRKPPQEPYRDMMRLPKSGRMRALVELTRGKQVNVIDTNDNVHVVIKIYKGRYSTPFGARSTAEEALWLVEQKVDVKQYEIVISVSL